jgi:NADPH:quinone reductase-like Zn-dependent oxidoreductase
MTTGANALWHVAPQRSEIRSVKVSARSDDVIVRTVVSAISRGTERLVWSGAVPESEYARMRAPFQEGDFPFPVKYGYACVGRVEAGPAALLGRLVFALHPHQTLFALPAAAVTPLPAGADPRRACLAANMETALNAVWDSGAAPGDRIAVIGGGAVGALTAALLTRLPGAEVWVVDVAEARAEVAARLGAAFATPDRAPEGCDVSFHCSASAGGLATAMATLGPEATLVEMSWHGAGETPVALGGAFHSQRLRIVSSQVGSLPPARRPRWDHARRLAKALEIVCADARLDALLSADVPFAALPARLPAIFGPDWPGLAPIVSYG